MSRGSLSLSFKVIRVYVTYISRTSMISFSALVLGDPNEENTPLAVPSGGYKPLSVTMGSKQT